MINYILLPFRFTTINAETEIIVNEIGDFVFLPIGTTQKIIKRQINKEIDTELYNLLVSRYFICENLSDNIINVLSSKYKTRKSFLDNFTVLHIFVITLRCEHTCHYCQVSRVTQNKVNYDMTESHIDKGIEFMMKSPSKNVNMEFQGGEPLLAFDKIKYGVKKAQEQAILHDKNVRFVICTNLALIDNEILDFCKINNITISTSLDGPEHLHNANRAKSGNKSFELTKNGINICREKLGDSKIWALMTTTKYSLECAVEIIETYREFGFNQIFLRPISPYGFAVQNEKKNKYEAQNYVDFYKKGLDYIIDLNLKGIYFEENYARIILTKMLTNIPVGFVDLTSPAGLINRAILFNYDGKVYASDESRMLAEMKDYSFLLGNLDNQTYENIFYGKKAFEIAQNSVNESLAGCSDCAFQSYCGADPVLHHATQGDMYGYRPSSTFCQRNMEIIRHLFDLMNQDKRIENIFRSWIQTKYKNNAQLKQYVS